MEHSVTCFWGNMHRIAQHVAFSPTHLIFILAWITVCLLYNPFPSPTEADPVRKGSSDNSWAHCRCTWFSIPNPAMPFKLFSGNVRPDPTFPSSWALLSSCLRAACSGTVQQEQRKANIPITLGQGRAPPLQEWLLCLAQGTASSSDMSHTLWGGIALG